MTGSELISAERERQYNEKGYTVEVDEQHKKGELLVAAMVYVENIRVPDALSRDAKGVPRAWVWDKKRWKPTTPIRDLVKAGALIAAEIDRRLAQGDKA